MERLTPERGERTWRLFHIGWYVNFAAFLGVLALALWFLWQVVSGQTNDAHRDLIVMMGFAVMAPMLLIGAGISRYQARLEGQHLELKLAINKTNAALEKLQGNSDSE